LNKKILNFQALAKRIVGHIVLTTALVDFRKITNMFQLYVTIYIDLKTSKIEIPKEHL
jgi:hypothetical protein